MSRKWFILTAVAALGLIALQAPLMAQQQANPQAAEVRQAIRDSYEYGRVNLKDAPDAVASGGSWGFWSSGGLVQYVPDDDASLNEYVSNSLRPKHIRVIRLADGIAVAQFYVEGSFQVKGEDPVGNYLTRVTQVMVKENGMWKVKADHFSPVTGGSGTNQNALP